MIHRHLSASRRNWDAVKTAALIAVAIGILILCYELSLLARASRQDLASVTANLNTLIVTANQTALNLRDAAASARDASEQAKLAAIEQRAYWAKTSLETYKTMAAVRLTIVRTDRSLNDVLVPKLSLTLDGTTELSRSAAANLARTMDELQPTLQNMGRASAAAADTMADPAIRETLAHLEETSKHAADTADQTAQAMANVNATTRDVAAYVHRMTTPVRGTWSLVKELLGLAYQSRGALGK